MHLRNCLQIATYGRTVSNRLHEHGIRLRRYTDPCVDQRLTFCGDSEMAWAGITARRRTLLVIPWWNPTATCYSIHPNSETCH